MGFEDYVSEVEAASVAGVSVATLQRFAEAGYLHAESDSDGLKLFSKSEIKNVFGLHEAELYRAEALDSEPKTAATTSVQQEPEQNVAPMQTQAPISEPIAAATQSKPNLAERVTLEREPAPNMSQRNASLDLVQKLERAIAKLQTVTEMQEKLLAIKDERIKNLEENANWLKSRIEHMEEKGDRDQLLLLAETQTIRTLVASTTHRKSSIRQALEWFGLMPPTSDAPPPIPRQTIDLAASQPAQKRHD